jgi:CrcB protein
MTAEGNARKSAIPAHRQPKLILYVFLGGVIGAAARAGLSLALPTAPGGVPWAILIANLVGAFLLGVLLTAIGVHAVETRARRELRLFAGTGVLGGFTTYSSLAEGTAELLRGDVWLGAAYALGTLVLGLVVAVIGVRAVEWLATRRGWGGRGSGAGTGAEHAEGGSR